MSKKKNPPVWALMFAGVWSASCSCCAFWDRSCVGVGFSAIFAFISMAAFAELADRIKEQGR